MNNTPRPMNNTPRPININNKVWLKPFATPMVEDAFKFVTQIVIDGYTGAVIWGPTRTGKTSLIRLFVNDVKKVKGRRGDEIESGAVSMKCKDRWVMSEGGFWDWQLRQFGHNRAGARDPVQIKRHIACEFLKGIAAQSPSGRVIVFIDEAQLLELVELGLFADQFNDLEEDGFEMVLFLVGSYNIKKWQLDLKGNSDHAHVRSRFFSQEHRLRGLSTLKDYQRCLKRYDVDKSYFDGERSITEYYQADWYKSGERLEQYAAMFKDAFAEAIGRPQSFQVPMAYFKYTVQNVLNRPKMVITPDRMKNLVKRSKFVFNYTPDTEANTD